MVFFNWHKSIPTSHKACSSAMLVLSIVGNFKKYDFGVVPNGIMPIPNFIQIRPAVLEFNHANRRTDTHDQPYMRLFHAQRAKNA
jgi:hypothetical protein